MKKSTKIKVSKFFNKLGRYGKIAKEEFEKGASAVASGSQRVNRVVSPMRDELAEVMQLPQRKPISKREWDNLNREQFEHELSYEEMKEKLREHERMLRRKPIQQRRKVNPFAMI